jgi:tetratricopeptide (TPR) repeat protein
LLFRSPDRDRPMPYRFLVIVFLVLAKVPLDAATLKGVILANELSGSPMENVGVNAVSGTNLTTSDLFGKFTLEFPQRHIGDTVHIIVKKEGYVVVNDVQLETVLTADADAAPLTVILAKEGDREQMARRFYWLKSFEAIKESYQKRLKELEDTRQATAAALTKLQQERDQTKESAEKLAEEMAKSQPGQSSELYKQAQRLFLDGKIDQAIGVLDDDKLRRSAEQAEKDLAEAIQGWRLKAQLFSLKYRFEEAEKAYEMALRHINRETDAQLWAETEVDVGIAHGELGVLWDFTYLCWNLTHGEGMSRVVKGSIQEYGEMFKESLFTREAPRMLIAVSYVNNSTAREITQTSKAKLQGKRILLDLYRGNRARKNGRLRSANYPT